MAYCILTFKELVEKPTAGCNEKKYPQVVPKAPFIHCDVNHFRRRTCGIDHSSSSRRGGSHGSSCCGSCGRRCSIEYVLECGIGKHAGKKILIRIENFNPTFMGIFKKYNLYHYFYLLPTMLLLFQ